MKKILFILALAAMTTNVLAARRYCDPKSTIMGGFAQDWEHAISPAIMPITLTGMLPGDTLCIKGGTIYIESLTDLWEITENITVIGGFDPTLTGTNVTMPIYPSSTPTILDGDVNRNGKPDEGDAPALIRIDLSATPEKVVTLQGLVLRNTYYYKQGESTEDLNTYDTYSAALRIMRGTVYVKYCEIYNNFTGNRGSQTVTVVGANAHFIDCDFHHGVSESRGGLLRSRDYFPNPKNEKDNPVSPSIVLERCALHHASALGGQQFNASGPYGGALHASTGEVFAINSTFVLDSCYSKGGSLRGNASGLTLISCTIGQNFGTRIDDPEPANGKAESYGSSIGLDGNVPVRFANTIMLDDKDKGTKPTAPFYTDDNTVMVDEILTSGDYNLLGTVCVIAYTARVTDFSSVWQAHDTVNVCKNNRFTEYFGDIHTNFKDNGGCSKTIMPKRMLNGASVADLQKFANEYCPDWTHVYANFDQRGYVRDKNQTCIGAVDPTADMPTAISPVKADVLNNDMTLYNLLGQPVTDDYRGVVIQKGRKYMLQ